MSERQKQRAKDHNQTSFQLNSRQSRNYLSGRLVSLIRCNDQSGEFSAQELIQIESLLRDEFQTNQWLLSVCKAITDESIVVSKEDLQMYETYKCDEQQVSVIQSVTHSDVDQLHEELHFLRERLNVLRNIVNDLKQKLIEIQRNDLNNEMNAKKSHSIDIWLQLRIKLKESLEIIAKDLTTDFIVDEPKDIIDFITNQLNDKIVTINSIQSPKEWLDRVLDELALTKGNKKQVLDTFNQKFYLKLEDIHKNLNNLFKECVRIKDFYEVNVKQEMSWRSDLNALITHLQSLDNSSKTIRLNSVKTQTNELLAKKRSIEEYLQFFEKFEKLEFDELQALMEALNQRVQMLTDKSKRTDNTVSANK